MKAPISLEISEYTLGFFFFFVLWRFFLVPLLISLIWGSHVDDCKHLQPGACLIILRVFCAVTHLGIHPWPSNNCLSASLLFTFLVIVNILFGSVPYPDIHIREPAGDILLFMTGQVWSSPLAVEIGNLSISSAKARGYAALLETPTHDYVYFWSSLQSMPFLNLFDPRVGNNIMLKSRLVVHSWILESEFVSFLQWQDEILKAITGLEEKVKALEEGSCLDVIILPLYASLPPEVQACNFISLFLSLVLPLDH